MAKTKRVSDGGGSGPKGGPALPVSRPGHNATPLLYLQNIVIKAVMKHKQAWPFLEPVDVKKLNIPDYNQIVKQPMDFGTIEKRLSNNFYQSAEAGIKDCNLVFTNSHLYNKAGSDVAVMARNLEKMFRHLLTGMPKEELNNAGIKVKKGNTESSKPQFEEWEIQDEGKEEAERERELVGLKERQRALMVGGDYATIVPQSNTAIVNHGGEKRSAQDGSESAKKAKMGASAADMSASEPKMLPMAFNEIKDLYHEINKLSNDKLLEVGKIIQQKEGNKGESIGPNEVEIDLETLEPKTLYYLKVFVKQTLRKSSKKVKSTKNVSKAGGSGSGGKREKPVSTGGDGGQKASSEGGGESSGGSTSG